MTRRAGDQAFTKNEIRRLMRVADASGKPYEIAICHDRQAKKTEYKLKIDPKTNTADPVTTITESELKELI